MATTPQLLESQSGLPVDNPTNSYWHKDPSEKLLGHRTTEKLPGSADVVIVGSGLTGAIAAHTLKERRTELDVVMLEAREACWGATGRNGGHCQPATYTSPPHIASFELRNFAYLKSLVETYSIPCDWHSTSGVHAYFSPSLFHQASDVVKRLGETYPDLAANMALVKKGDNGPPAYLLEGERRELTLEGLRVPDAEGAVVQWQAASLWPYKLVAFVLERLLAAGGFNLQTNTPVTGLQRVEPPASLTSPGGASHPTWIVHTPRGTMAARSVLLATNAYTSHLLPQFSDLIVPTRGQVAALLPPEKPHEGQPPLDIGHTYLFVGDGGDKDGDKRDDYLIQRPPPAAELILGGGRQHAKGRAVGVWDDSTMDEPVRWWLKGELPGVLDLSLRDAPQDAHHAGTSDKDDTTEKKKKPQKQDLDATHEWTGIMGFSRDGTPWAGPVPETLGGGDGLWLCAGYTGHGMPNAPLSACAVAEMMVGGDEVEVDLPPEYEITEDRVDAVRAGDTVEVADSKGFFFYNFFA